MAKEKVKADSAEDVAGPGVEAPAAPAPKENERPKGIHLGLSVIYRRPRQGGYASDLEEFHAVVIGLPPKTSNYQAKDGAVTLEIQGRFGREVKDAMFAHNSNEYNGRWTFNDKKELTY